ncbi:hypothetical protein FHS43_000821 [Streptosporangium becharense]|uniref:RNA polymerase sigma factor 70 region 4 type 2 domain-containing protein n=1 Tax=Streptosporangium becharense TaxID=1816182 RepID=A0A7W9IEW4_9ACTN|nr:sigma-70 region 4 domain-containing protein [Streptosporangium becharense]MBB2909575.1 hypothetical protein [Streptosporangium becharense]MBB5819469.1 hypothetical protein [Streptosporangium becharense]
MQRDQRSLVGTALLLTGSHDQAIRLALRSFHTVAQTWPPPLWENPTTHAQIALYRRFLQRPSAAGSTALVRLPPRQRLLVVACLHDGRTRADMAGLLGLPEETVEQEITEAVKTLTNGNESRLVTRMANAAGEASVPDLTGLSMRTLRRRRTRGVLLGAAAVLVPVGLIAGFALVQQGEVWNSALGEGGHARSPQARAQEQEPVGAVSTPRRGTLSEPGTTPTPAGTPEVGTTPAPGAAAKPWQPPRTSSVIRYAAPERCPDGGTAAPPRSGQVSCTGWTLKLVSDGREGRDGRDGSAECEGRDRCESTLSIPDAAQRLAHGDDRRLPRLYPAISPDGRRIAYLSAAEGRYVAHDLKSGVKRYLSPVLTPEDTEDGTLVSVSSDGRRFTVTLGERRLRTDFATGTLTSVPAEQMPATEKAAGWLREKYGTWKDSPSGKYAAAVTPGEGGRESLHVVDAGSRRVFKTLSLPEVERPARAEVVGWPGTREVVVRMNAASGGGLLGYFRMDAVTGRAEPVPGLPEGDPIVLGASTAL